MKHSTSSSRAPYRNRQALVQSLQLRRYPRRLWFSQRPLMWVLQLLRYVFLLPAIHVAMKLQTRVSASSGQRGMEAVELWQLWLHFLSSANLSPPILHRVPLTRSQAPQVRTVTAIQVSKATATVYDTTTIYSASLVWSTITHESTCTVLAPQVTTSTIFQSVTDYQTVQALTTRTVFATQISVITSTLADTTSIVLRPTTIYSTNLVGTTFTLTSTTYSTLERGITTTIFTGRTVTSTVTANLLNLPIRAEPTQASPATFDGQQSEEIPIQPTSTGRYWAPFVHR